MSRLLVHVEGQTEERFVNAVLAPHLHSVGYTSVGARLLGNARQRNRRGGIRAWDAVRTDILKHLAEDQAALATTMVDYYGLPDTWPGRSDSKRESTTSARAATIERGLLEDISDSVPGGSESGRFVPYVVMHEFEGLLFSDPNRFAQGINRSDLSPEFQRIRGAFSTPEEINDLADTAPSKRVGSLHGGYQKPLMGVLAAEAVGLDTIRRECPLFDNWIKRLEQQIG